jgi:copper transporter 1
MDMSMGSSSNMSMGSTFVNSHTTPLYSIAWTPKSSGGYAGTCIFLIILAIIYRVLLAGRHIVENRWRDKAWQRRYIVVADRTPVSEQLQRDPDAKTAILTANGVEEHVKIVHRPTRGVQPWRFSVDLPRAILTTIVLGVGYLL